jgi:hypothetical protein
MARAVCGSFVQVSGTALVVHLVPRVNPSVGVDEVSRAVAVFVLAPTVHVPVRYTRMKPADAAKMNESGDDEDSDGTTKKLQDGAEAAHDLMNKTLETLDAKIKELFNAQRTQLSKAAQQHQLALKVKVKEFQTEVAK